MSIFQWIESNYSPVMVTSDEFIYEDLPSQSLCSLPIIYEEFNGNKCSHWADRGFVFDFLYSTDTFGKTVLDFGPGDGWPSLVVAPYVKKVCGLDASLRRVETCIANSQKLNLHNTKFLNYSPNSEIPYRDNFFDGIYAASSIEQTPDPEKTIKELYRVLKPGGKIRIRYEALDSYEKSNRQNDVWVTQTSKSQFIIVFFNRNFHVKSVTQYALTTSVDVYSFFKDSLRRKELEFDDFTVEKLKKISGSISKVKKCLTHHPNGCFFKTLLKKNGFEVVSPTQCGGEAAKKCFKNLTEKRNYVVSEVDSIVRPLVERLVMLESPIESNPPITALKK